MQHPDGNIPHFTRFKHSAKDISLPERFTFPFYYDPHPIAIQAAEELQAHLESQTDLVHNFGLDPEQEGLVIGKMFGVLVVEHPSGEIGYLSAFSGKLANSNHHAHFVPPVFDILTEDGFFKKGELEVNAINEALENALVNPDYLKLLEALNNLEFETKERISAHKSHMKSSKAQRDARRKEGEQTLDDAAFESLQADLSRESIQEKFMLKDMTKHFEYRIADLRAQLLPFEQEIENLKEARKVRSAALQQQLFAHYAFLNQHGHLKSLGEIFANMPDARPPAGAGECAAPKLLHYAYKNELKPIALAEFWWGQSPKSEVRNHKQYYPACRGKCEPILGHMLQGLQVEDNPLLHNPAAGKQFEILFEDEWIVVVNKPEEFLSVPGKSIQDSVYERLRALYPQATGPLLVHRLDMSTSGILLAAKDKDVHEHLQRQFTKRSVNKKYVALLAGIPLRTSGNIDLPLRVDLEDRPRQLVCHTYGKRAVTRFEVVETRGENALVHLYPYTGRTHQLRVHAAHRDGLGVPILGDDLYGTKGERLHLHAAELTFTHPVTKEIVHITAPIPF
jgi:tRNA pseudouridine32 synthase/23S rRNA pseudouridine746 synthase